MKRKKQNRKVTARAMVPCTDAIMNTMVMRVMEIMRDHGLITVNPDDPDDTAAQVEAVMQTHGLTNLSGDYPLGRCLLLPTTDRPGFSLLLATPWPADEHDEALRLKPSPVRFDRNRHGRIVLPGRWLLAKLEELANNPAAPEPLRTLALNLARRAQPLPPLVLPPQVETLSLMVEEGDGTKRLLEALPSGLVICVGHMP